MSYFALTWSCWKDDPGRKVITYPKERGFQKSRNGSHDQEHVIRPQIVVRLRYMCFFSYNGGGVYSFSLEWVLAQLLGF